MIQTIKAKNVPKIYLPFLHSIAKRNLWTRQLVGAADSASKRGFPQCALGRMIRERTTVSIAAEAETRLGGPCGCLMTNFPRHGRPMLIANTDLCLPRCCALSGQIAMYSVVKGQTILLFSFDCSHHNIALICVHVMSQ
jgi:hypothetical protein